MNVFLPFFFILGLIVFLVLISSIRILREYERGVVFALGRFWRIKGPGIIFVIPVIQEMVRVDIWTVVMDVPTQDIITNDGVTTRINAVVYFKVMNARDAIVQVENFFDATSMLAQTTLRSVLGQHELDQILSDRDKLNHEIQKILDEQTDAWGIKVTTVEIKDVDVDETIIKAMAQKAVAERDRRAKVIHAEGELQASTKLEQAATILAKQPAALQLRYLQTANDISGKASSILLPLPMDIFKSFSQEASKSKK